MSNAGRATTGKSLSDIIDAVTKQIKTMADRLLGQNSFNTVPLLLALAAWIITGDVYIVTAGAIAAVGPATKAESIIVPLAAAIILRRGNKSLSRVALVVAAACYVGIVPALADPIGSGNLVTEGTAMG